jgi:hypothetical protein
MFRKLLILGAIVALFTIATVVPASAIAVNTGNGAKTVLDDGLNPVKNPAHGPLCGAGIGDVDCSESPGVSTDYPGRPGDGPMVHPTNSLGINAGAWNAVLGPGGTSNLNSAICGVTVEDTTFDNECVQPIP